MQKIEESHFLQKAANARVPFIDIDCSETPRRSADSIPPIQFRCHSQRSRRRQPPDFAEIYVKPLIPPVLPATAPDLTKDIYYAIVI